MKQPFLVCYDYGMGGVWSIIHARSRDEIEARYPEFFVVLDRPVWVTEAEYARIAEVRSFDIDDPKGWLKNFEDRRDSRK